MSIELSQQARAHPLFPLLDFLVKSTHRQQRLSENVDGRLSRLENELSSIKELQSELQKLVKEFGEGVWRKYIRH